METLDAFKLDNKIAVVTGAAGLLGVKHVEAVLEAGGSVAALDLEMGLLERTLGELREKFGHRLFFSKGDVTSKEKLLAAQREIVEHFSVDPQILINNAAVDPKFDYEKGASPKSRLENFPEESWDFELNVGLKGAMFCTQVFGAAMKSRGSGVILNIASDLAVIAPDQRIYRDEELEDEMQNVKPVTYSVIKHGLIGLTKYVATYWADEGIRCNAFAPGGVFNNHPEKFLKKLTPLIPIGRMAHRDEYKAAIVFLVSDASSYMNGATLNMDGGRSVW